MVRASGTLAVPGLCPQAPSHLSVVAPDRQELTAGAPGHGLGPRKRAWTHTRAAGPSGGCPRVCAPHPPAEGVRVGGQLSGGVGRQLPRHVGPHLACVAVLSDCPPERALPLDSGPASSVLSFTRRWPGLEVPVAGSPRAGVPPGRLCWARGESTVFVPSGVTSERVLPVKPNVALVWLTARARTPGRTDVCRGALGAGRGGGAGPGGTPPPRAPGMRCLLKLTTCLLELSRLPKRVRRPRFTASNRGS